MANKTSIRFFEDVPVRAVWDNESANGGFAPWILPKHSQKQPIQEYTGQR